MSELAALCEGWDGRRIRKLMLAALASGWRCRAIRRSCPGTIFSPPRAKGGVEWAGGRALTSAELFPDVPKELMHDHDHGHAIHDHGDGPHDHSHPHRHTHTHQHDEDGLKTWLSLADQISVLSSCFSLRKQRYNKNY